MDVASLIAFAAIFAVACASPGPTIAALVARVLGRGTAGAPFLCGGLLVGDLVWLACAAFGLAALAALFEPVLVVVKYVGAAYLLFLAWKLWTAPPAAPGQATPARGEGPKLFLGGLAIALGNPKTMLFYLALLPTIISLDAVSPAGFAQLAAVVTAVYGTVLTLYVLTAAQARRAFRSPRAMRIVNRATGGMMAGAAVAVATRS